MTAPFDVYFSADIETDGPIPGPFSMLSFALVLAGTYDGEDLVQFDGREHTFYRELKPITDGFDPETLAVSGLDRDALVTHGANVADAMTDAAEWVTSLAGEGTPVLIAYPLSFDWSWLYWYFVAFGRVPSPFRFSSCLDIKTALAIKTNRPIARSGRSQLPHKLRSPHAHTHHAVDDAIEQADVFFRILRSAEVGS